MQHVVFILIHVSLQLLCELLIFITRLHEGEMRDWELSIFTTVLDKSSKNMIMLDLSMIQPGFMTHARIYNPKQLFRHSEN